MNVETLDTVGGLERYITVPFGNQAVVLDICGLSVSYQKGVMRSVLERSKSLCHWEA
jgi:hypothetical protein